jgi:hypothetical protein
VSEDEIFVMLCSAAVIVLSFSAISTMRLTSMLRRNNPGLGLVKLAVPAGLVWIWFVLLNFAAPSVVGVYVYFYLFAGLAAILGFGANGVRLFGVNVRVDVGERRNWAAAVFCASFILGTSLIFGGSVWGEADPHSDYEGGWWIPGGFFLMGWGVMAAMVALYCWRVPGGWRTAILSNRDIKTASAAGSFVVGTACMMTEAVSGDFLGWGEGVFTVSLSAGMLFSHELFRSSNTAVHVASTKTKVLESVLYLVLAGLNFLRSYIW